MSALDEASVAIGRLQAAQEATSTAVGELKTSVSEMSGKLDKLLLRERSGIRLNWKQWIMLIVGTSSGGGGLAHLLRKVLG